MSPLSLWRTSSLGRSFASAAPEPPGGGTDTVAKRADDDASGNPNEYIYPLDDKRHEHHSKSNGAKKFFQVLDEQTE